MKKINHNIYVQKDLHEFWSSDWGWLHIGDLVRLYHDAVVENRAPSPGVNVPPMTAMVLGFFYDPHCNPERNIVAVHPAHDPSAVWFIAVEHCSPAGAQ